jgi:hypothetical protein
MWEKESGRSRGDVGALMEVIDDLSLKISVATQALGIALPTVRPGVEESILGHFYAKIFPKKKKTAMTDETRVVSRLLSLNLPGIDFTQVDDIVNVSHEPVFGEVREAVKKALAAAEQENDIKDAKRAAAEVFQASRRPRQSFAKTFGSSLLPKAVSFGIGAAIATNLGAWQPMLPFIAEATVEAAQALHRGKARKAQEALYIALARTDPAA